MAYHYSRRVADDDSDDGTVYSDADSYDSRSEASANGPGQGPTLDYLMSRSVL